MKVSRRWEARLESGATMILEFLAEHPEHGGGKVKILPTEGNVSSLSIPHASMVFDLYDTTELTAELLGGGGLATETVRYANIVSFTCLKAFAFDDRNAREDAHDLVYCLEHHPGGLDAVIGAFKHALAVPHADAVREALAKLETRFVHEDADQSYRRDGPVAVARFEDNDADAGDNKVVRDLRILRQRRVAELMGKFLDSLAQAGEKRLLALAGKDSDAGNGSPPDFADAVEQLRGKVRIVIKRGRLAKTSAISLLPRETFSNAALTRQSMGGCG